MPASLSDTICDTRCSFTNDVSSFLGSSPWVFLIAPLTWAASLFFLFYFPTNSSSFFYYFALFVFCFFSLLRVLWVCVIGAGWRRFLPFNLFPFIIVSFFPLFFFPFIHIRQRKVSFKDNSFLFFFFLRKQIVNSGGKKKRGGGKRLTTKSCLFCVHRHHYLLFIYLFIFSVEEKRVEKNKQANRGNRCIFILYKNFMCAFFLSLRLAFFSKPYFSVARFSF